jgi:hypothetical protein
MAGMARSPQSRRGALVEEPTHDKVNNPLAVVLSGELIEPANRCEILRVARRPEFRVYRAKIVARKMRVLRQLSR